MKREIKFRAFVDFKKFKVMIQDVQLGIDTNTCGITTELLEEVLEKTGWKMNDDYEFVNESTGEKISMYDAGALDSGEDWVHLENCIIMQYTGCKDREENEIYEGDILDFDAKEWGADGFTSAVEWNDKDASWSFGGGLTSDLKSWRKVVGNICQNPELISSAVGV